MSLLIRTDIPALARRLKGKCLVITDKTNHELPDLFIQTVEKLLGFKNPPPELMTLTINLFEEASKLEILDDLNPLLNAAILCQSRVMILAQGVEAQRAVAEFRTQASYIVKQLDNGTKAKKINNDTLSMLQNLHDVAVDAGVVLIPRGGEHYV